MKKICLILIAFISFAFMLNVEPQSAFAGYQIKADAYTKRLPRGTKMELRMVDPVTTQDVVAGDMFSAALVEDVKLAKSVVLPAGSIVRGTVAKLTKPGRLSRSAVLYLNFDHVVTPSGRQLPITAGLCSNFKITDDGAISAGGNYGYALAQNWYKTTDIVKNTAHWGVRAGDELFTGGKYLLTPIAVVGGTIAGSTYLIVDSIADIFKKGDDVIINQGKIFDILLLEPLDVPLS